MSADEKITFGINLSHDTACAAVIGGEVRFAIAEERLNRVKYCTGATPFGKMIPYRSIRYCCEGLGITPSDVDLWVVNSCRSNALDQLKSQLLGIDERRVIDVPHPGHHLSHAFSAFYCSAFEEAAVIVLDTNGAFFEMPGESADSLLLERKEHFTCYHGDGNGLKVVMADHVYPGEVSLGELYCIYSAALQLTPKEGNYGFDCPLSAGGKLMGLASWDLGRTPAPRLWDFEDGHMSIRLARVVDHLDRAGFVERRDSELDSIFGFQMRPHVELKRRKDSLREDRYLSLAGEAQRALEEALLAIARSVHAKTGSKNLCLAGGTMLNVTACTRLLEETSFERIFIQPAANDSGNAIGAALYGYREVLGGRTRPYLERDYDTCLGRSFSPESIERAIRKARTKATFTERRVSTLAEKSAALLPRILRDEIVAVFDGGSEFGPRALGHRSFLASPRKAEMRDRMNELKHREWYRPVAPAVLEEDFAEYFVAPFAKSPFMTLSARCTDRARERAPAIVHVDGTSRPQTVTATASPVLHQLLVESKRAAAIPVLVNTSYNVDGEPIVETPEDAIAAFLKAELLPCLLLGDHVLEKQ
ncbi:MAG TPA: carbamoyltransferase C-terminal domain-containing protein [Polyangiaceae bacterium]